MRERPSTGTPTLGRHRGPVSKPLSHLLLSPPTRGYALPPRGGCGDSVAAHSAHCINTDCSTCFLLQTNRITSRQRRRLCGHPIATSTCHHHSVLPPTRPQRGHCLHFRTNMAHTNGVTDVLLRPLTIPRRSARVQTRRFFSVILLSCDRSL